VKLRVTQPRLDSCALVAVDGQRNLRICQGGEVEITVAPQRLKLIHPASFEHFSVVRTKLKWSGGVKNGS
jgi:NAD+ kinase